MQKWENKNKYMISVAAGIKNVEWTEIVCYAHKMKFTI